MQTNPPSAPSSQQEWLRTASTKLKPGRNEPAASTRASAGCVPRSIPRAGYPGGGTLPSHCSTRHRCCWPPALRCLENAFSSSTAGRGALRWVCHHGPTAAASDSTLLPGNKLHACLGSWSGFAFPAKRQTGFGKVSAARVTCPVTSFSKKNHRRHILPSQ